MGLISGAVGNYVHMPPELETLVCEELGLAPSPISTQILQRDRHAEFMSVCAIISGTLDKMATEIRALQKTEFNEATEPFSSKQKGSSAMPHKRNLITCERISGLSCCSAVMRVTAYENQNLWHERDISHSSAERVIFTDATIALDYMFGLMTKVMSGLVVNPEEMKANIDRSYHVFFSQQLLLALVETGMTREDAYRLVQKNAIEAFTNKILFREKVDSDTDITGKLSKDKLDELFSFEKYARHVDTIFDRVFIN